MSPARAFREALKSAIAVAFGLAACGGGGGSTNTPGVERSEAQKQCDAVMNAWCESAVECVQAGLSPEDKFTDAELDNERELCLDVAKRTCDATLGVNDGLDACQSSVDSLSDADCEAIRTAVSASADVSMPAACIDLFITD
jgi:hypothetical protein